MCIYIYTYIPSVCNCKTTTQNNYTTSQLLFNKLEHCIILPKISETLQFLFTSDNFTHHLTQYAKCLLDFVSINTNKRQKHPQVEALKNHLIWLNTLQPEIRNLLQTNTFSVTSCCSYIILRHSTHKCPNFMCLIFLISDLIFLLCKKWKSVFIKVFIWNRQHYAVYKRTSYVSIRELNI